MGLNMSVPGIRTCTMPTPAEDLEQVFNLVCALCSPFSSSSPDGALLKWVHFLHANDT